MYMYRERYLFPDYRNHGNVVFVRNMRKKSENGECEVAPPGFRFHPTEDELLQYYLRKKVRNEKMEVDVIRDVDLNKVEPWEIQEKCKIGRSSEEEKEWYLFSHKDKKYPSGSRTNRATGIGFWKATGRDKIIYTNSSKIPIGMRKTLVFYKGRAPHGHKSDWIMHEYTLCHNTTPTTPMEEEGWVVCKVFKKKHHHLASMSNNIDEERSESPKSTTQQNNNNNNDVSEVSTRNTNWETLHRLVASQLNGQNQTEEDPFHQLFASFSTHTSDAPSILEQDLSNFAPCSTPSFLSVPQPLSPLSNSSL